MNPSTTQKSLALWFPLIVIASVLGVFVWPTFWSTAVIGGNTWRFSRFGGCSEVLTPIGWIPAGPQRCDGNGDTSQEIQRDQKEAAPAVWTADATDGEVYASIDKLAKRLRIVRAWTDTIDNVPLFHVEVQNDSACTVTTVLMTVTDQVYGEMPGFTLDPPPDALPSDDVTIAPGGRKLGSTVSIIAMDRSPEEVPVSRLNVKWNSALPMMGDSRGCEDQAAETDQ
jgi:hypothetical protein